MRPFTYERATAYSDAAARLEDAGAVALGGGTDLLVCIEDGIASPTTVVDVRWIRDGDPITVTANGGLRISAHVRLETIASNSLVRERAAALALACESVGTPALRNMATLGGNLCQRPRCWYFRRGIPCLKNGGSDCPARAGENRYLAILDGGPCHIVHPSDPAVALTALEASVEITSSAGTRTVPIAEFYQLPRDRVEHETILRHDELVSAVVIDAASLGGEQVYRKAMQRGAWDFALVSIAAIRRGDGGVRLTLGGVAPRPWRIPNSVEEDVASGGLDEESIAALAERALYDAAPLSQNGYKVPLAASLIRDAIRDIAAA